MKYVCKLCNKDFKQKSNYINHTEKKKNTCRINEVITNTELPINTSNNLKVNL